MIRFNRLVWIPKEAQQYAGIVSRVRKELTVVGRFSEFAKERDSKDHFPIFCETDLEVGIPPEYMRKNYHSIFASLNDETSVGVDIVPPLVFNGQLEKKLRQDEAVAAVGSKRSTILSLQCGGGKTVISLYLLAQVNKKALVVVPTKVLQEQWKTRIESFLPGCRVGLLNGKKLKFKIENTDIVVACMKSLSDPGKYPASFFDNFGAVVYDEVHKVCARTMVRCMWQTLSRWNLGLSATPKRQDGLESVLKATLGEVCFRTERHDENVEVQVLTSPGYFDNPYDSSMEAIGVWLTKLCNNRARNEFIAEKIAELAENPKRNILVLSDRVKHLENLKLKVESRQTSPKLMSMYTGEMKISERAKVEKYQVLFATFGIAGVGLDLSHLNTVVFCTPHVADTTEQATGRVLRGGYEALGCAPGVFDIIENCSHSRDKAERRISWYNSSGFHVMVDGIERHSKKRKVNSFCFSLFVNNNYTEFGNN